ncbi:MAG: ATP-binding protein [Planctomycetota bacterium]
MSVTIERTVAFPSSTPAQPPPLLVITGPRAVGKTHLSQLLFPTHRRASLSLPTEAARAQLDPAAFLAGLPAPVVIDDVHLAPRLVHHVARAIEAKPCPPAGYVLVGSRPLTLAAAASEACDRGAGVLRVDGLSHAEVSAARPELSIEQRLLRGGFPAVYADPQADVGEFMRALVADHLARELPLQLRVDSVHDFERFLRAAACRTGRLLNKAELAREVGIAGSTAAIWLDTLADAGVITLVRPWRPPQGKPLVKAPKLYFLDSGLCAALLGLRDEQDLAASPHMAALWETFVHAELRRLLAATAPHAELAFWRDRTKEVDFLLPMSGGLVLVDASWSEVAPPAIAGRLLRIREAIGGDAVAAVAIACRTPHRQALRDPAGPVVETVGLDDLPGLLG